MQVKNFRAIKFLAGNESDAVKRETLRALAIEVPQIDVFEACASGEITAEQGAMILMLRREAEYADRPWFVRFFLWVGCIFFGGSEP